MGVPIGIESQGCLTPLSRSSSSPSPRALYLICQSPIASFAKRASRRTGSTNATTKTSRLLPESPSVLRIWGVEEMAKKVLAGDTNGEHDAIFDLVRRINGPRAV